MITSGLLTGVSLYTGTTDYAEYAPLIQTLGAQAQGVLLAHYSRSNEREADSLGLEYMSKVGQNPQGMVGLMELLAKGSQSKPGALELMFATHPLSSERLQTARNTTASQYKKLSKIPLNRERYMDNTAKLRSMKPVLENVQKGEVLQNKEKFSQAEPYLKSALRHNPRDYASLLLMSKCQFGLNRKKTALRYAEQAKAVYPREAQAHHVSGVIKLAQKQPQSAYKEFARSARLLPGNPNTTFLQAASLEGMQNKKGAAQLYKRYLSEVREGGQAKHAVQRLKSWGYMK
jgi:predicted Zn-dependent protease